MSTALTRINNSYHCKRNQRIHGLCFLLRAIHIIMQNVQTFTNIPGSTISILQLKGGHSHDETKWTWNTPKLQNGTAMMHDNARALVTRVFVYHTNPYVTNHRDNVISGKSSRTKHSLRTMPRAKDMIMESHSSISLHDWNLSSIRKPYLVTWNSEGCVSIVSQIYSAYPQLP